MFNGKMWKDGRYWLIEVPALDVMTEGRSRKEALFMIKDAVEELVDEKGFRVTLTLAKENEFVISSHDVAPLIALMLKRQRARQGLSLADMQEKLHAKSRNAYAQYEQGRSVPSVVKLVEFLRAMGETALLVCAPIRVRSR